MFVVLPLEIFLPWYAVIKQGRKVYRENTIYDTIIETIRKLYIAPIPLPPYPAGKLCDPFRLAKDSYRTLAN